MSTETDESKVEEPSFNEIKESIDKSKPETNKFRIYIYVLKQNADLFTSWLLENIPSSDGNYSYQKIASLLGYYTEYTEFTPDQLEAFLWYVRCQGYGHSLRYATKHSHSGAQGLHIRVGE